jgi:segregation and condensation protein A
MAQSPSVVTTLDGYQFRLPSFEGPLDVLLRLIERDQLAISEVSLLAVFDQFLAHLETLEADAPDAIAEFVLVAGRLSVLKSRALLPRPAKPLEEPDEIDLVSQLEAYRAVKAAAELLGVRQRNGSGAFGRGEAITYPAAEPARFAPQPPSALAEAVSRWLTRVPTKPALLPPHRVISLREMISRITSAFDRETRIPFDRIRATCAGPQDTAVAFLALLTLIRRHTLTANQSELFGPIELARGADVLRVANALRVSRPDGTHGESQRRA